MIVSILIVVSLGPKNVCKCGPFGPSIYTVGGGRISLSLREGLCSGLQGIAFWSCSVLCDLVWLHSCVPLVWLSFDLTVAASLVLYIFSPPYWQIFVQVSWLIIVDFVLAICIIDSLLPLLFLCWLYMYICIVCTCTCECLHSICWLANALLVTCCKA